MKNHRNPFALGVALALVLTASCKKNPPSPTCHYLRFDTSTPDTNQLLNGHTCQQSCIGGSADYHIDIVKVWLDKCTAPGDTVTMDVAVGGVSAGTDTQTPSSPAWFLEFKPRDSGGNTILVQANQAFSITLTCSGTCVWGINSNPTLPTISFYASVDGTIIAPASNFCTIVYSVECQ
jgi:hypothetical protein